MTRALIVLALLAPAPALLTPAATPTTVARTALCLPAPPRTTPHRKLERVDKWQHDQRTVT